MKLLRYCVFFVLMMVMATTLSFADKRFSIEGSYNMPIGNDKIDPSFAIGAEYHFWGVFTFSVAMYNDIVYGAENILNISQIRPIGLFSGGMGMKIPLGGFYVVFDWQKFYTGTSAQEGVFPFSDSYSIGASVDISESFSIDLYSRRLYNFSDQAIDDPLLRIETVTDTVDTIGIGASFHFF